MDLIKDISFSVFIESYFFRFVTSMVFILTVYFSNTVESFYFSFKRMQ